MAVTGGEDRGPEPAANTPEISPKSDQTAEPFQTPETSEDHVDPEVMTPELEAKQESEEHIGELLRAYLWLRETVDELHAVIWVPWDRKRPGSYFKVPYLRWFLKYFVVHHIDGYRSRKVAPTRPVGYLFLRIPAPRNFLRRRMGSGVTSTSSSSPNHPRVSSGVVVRDG